MNAVVEVSFGGAGNGGLHDVVLEDPETDPVVTWRNRQPVENILAVVQRAAEGSDDRFMARWFSRHGEIELCGSGAVAVGGWLFDRVAPAEHQLELLGRYHDVEISVDGSGVRIRLPNIPLEPGTPVPELHEALGVEGERSHAVSKRLRTHLTCLEPGADLSLVKPDFARLKGIVRPDLSAAIITSLHADGSAFTFRYFTPWHGLDESPVAASAHALLGAFWRLRTGRRRLAALQHSCKAPVYELEVDEGGTWVKGETRVVSER